MKEKAQTKKSLILPVILGLIFFSNPADALTKKVAGDLVFWDQTRGFLSIQNNPDIFYEVSPFWYTIDDSGAVIPYRGSTSTYEDPSIVNFLKSNNIKIVPTVANILDGVWNGTRVSNIINNPNLSSAHITNLVNMTVAKGYDGLDLDYEDLQSSDRAAFSSFVSNLASALHQQGKILTVDVYAKISEPGTWSGPQAQDYAAIGEAADEVRIMIYEYHWSTSAPGPIAPVSWTDDVVAFAKTLIPPDKIMQGTPFYGYDWVGSSGAEHVWQESVNIASSKNATINWDAASASAWFEYTSSGAKHTVWFENSASTAAKIDVAKKYGTGGLFTWRLGGEDPNTWAEFRNRLGSGYTRAISIASLDGRTNKAIIGTLIVQDSANNTIKTYTISTDSTGNSTVTFDIPVQTVFLKIKAAPFLAKRIQADLSSSAPYTFGQLVIGDLNQDNIVNSIDYSQLNSKWFGTDSATDLNQDGIVNSVDSSLINKNWFKQGD